MGDPTVAGGAGDPPRKLHLGEEGQANVIDGDEDHIVGDLSGNVRLVLDISLDLALFSRLKTAASTFSLLTCPSCRPLTLLGADSHRRSDGDTRRIGRRERRS